MGITLDRGRYYFVMNVPKHLFGKVLGKNGQPVKQIRQALQTADLSVAKRKAFELEELKRAEWQFLALGEEALAYEKYQAAKQISEAHGFDYVPSEVLLKRTFDENLPRLMAAAGTVCSHQPPEVVEALLGSVNVALPPLRKVLQEYVDLQKHDICASRINNGIFGGYLESELSQISKEQFPKEELLASIRSHAKMRWRSANGGRSGFNQEKRERRPLTKTLATSLKFFESGAS